LAAASPPMGGRQSSSLQLPPLASFFFLAQQQEAAPRRRPAVPSLDQRDIRDSLLLLHRSTEHALSSISSAILALSEMDAPSLSPEAGIAALSETSFVSSAVACVIARSEGLLLISVNGSFSPTIGKFETPSSPRQRGAGDRVNFFFLPLPCEKFEYSSLSRP